MLFVVTSIKWLIIIGNLIMEPFLYHTTSHLSFNSIIESFNYLIYNHVGIIIYNGCIFKMHVYFLKIVPFLQIKTYYFMFISYCSWSPVFSVGLIPRQQHQHQKLSQGCGEFVFSGSSKSRRLARVWFLWFLVFVLQWLNLFLYGLSPRMGVWACAFLFSNCA